MALIINYPLSERVQKSFQNLAAQAANLNAVSDELGISIQALDTALKSLNLGVEAWFTYYEDIHESGEYWSNRALGYAKIGGKWGISLQTSSGEYSAPPDDRVESWLFNDAPRWMRIESIQHIPDLMDVLGAETEKTVTKIRGKVGEAKQLAIAISASNQTASKKASAKEKS